MSSIRTPRSVQNPSTWNISSTGLIQLLDGGRLASNIPKDVLAEFVREIDRADFPLIPEQPGRD